MFYDTLQNRIYTPSPLGEDAVKDVWCLSLPENLIYYSSQVCTLDRKECSPVHINVGGARFNQLIFHPRLQLVFKPELFSEILSGQPKRAKRGPLQFLDISPARVLSLQRLAIISLYEQPLLLRKYEKYGKIAPGIQKPLSLDSITLKPK